MKFILKLAVVTGLLASSSAFAAVADLAAYGADIEPTEMLTSSEADSGAVIVQSVASQALIMQNDAESFAVIIQSLDGAYAVINQTGATGAKAVIIQAGQ